jgi:hypothetical protein
MGFLDFDPTQYLDGEVGDAAKVANPAKVDLLSEPPNPAKTLADLAALAVIPTDINAGIDRLQTLRAPRWCKSERWRLFVSDVVWLRDYGVAADAMRQGWTALDLFGVSGDEEWQSLAAWIEGKRDEFNRACILLREIRGERTLLYAVQALTASRRWHYPDPAPLDAKLPWMM